MVTFLGSFYKYYFYRIYLFTLNNWKSRGIAHFTATVLSSVPIMANLCTILILVNLIYGIKIPDKPVLIIYLLIFTTIFVAFNYFFIDRHFGKLLKDFKDEKKNKSQYLFRGWLIVSYFIGSYFLFFFIAFSSVDINIRRKKLEKIKTSIDIKQDSLNQAKFDSLMKNQPTQTR